LACGPGLRMVGRGRDAAGLGCESEPDSCPEVGDDLDGWVPAVTERRGRGEGLAHTGGPGEELACWAGSAVRKKGKKGRGLAGLGHKEEKERGKKKNREWVGPNR
jgi:hypothetical protein